MTKRSDNQLIFIFLVLVIKLKILTGVVYFLSTTNAILLFNKIQIMDTILKFQTEVTLVLLTFMFFIRFVVHEKN